MIYLTFFPDYKNHTNVNGNAIASEKLFLKYSKKKDIKLDTTSWNPYLTKIKKILFSVYAIILLIFKKQKSLYTVLLDNFGFYPHILFLFVASFFSQKIIVYHHSFKYVTEKKTFLYLLNSKNIINVATSKKQFRVLKTKYNLRNVYLVENFIFLLNDNTNLKVKTKKKYNIIFFSSIMERKGIFDFIDLSKKFYKKKNMNFFVYGNDCSPAMLKNLKDLKKQKIIKDFKLNIYGKLKEKVLSQNDILIFPSKHQSETTPLVLDESINYGLVPISYNIGDTKGQIGHLHLVVNSFNQLCKTLLVTIKNYTRVKKKIIKEKKNKLIKKIAQQKKLDFFFEEI